LLNFQAFTCSLYHQIWTPSRVGISPLGMLLSLETCMHAVGKFKAEIHSGCGGAPWGRS